MNMKKEKEKKEGQSFKTIWQNNRFMLRHAFRAAPLFSVYRLCRGAMNRLIVFIEHTWLLGYIIDAITTGRPFSEVALVILGVFVLATSWSNVFCVIVDARIAPIAQLKIRNRMLRDLYDKAADIDLACYDNPTFYDDYVWAVGDAPARVDQVLGTFDGLIAGVVALILGVNYIVSQDLMGLLVVVISFVSIFWMSRLEQKIWFAREERTKPIYRKLGYIQRLFYLNDHAKEIRLSDIVHKLREEYHAASLRAAEEQQKDSRKLALLTILMNYIFNTFLVDGLYILYLMFRTIVQKAISYGTMVVLYNSCNFVKNGFYSLAYGLPRLQQHSMYIEKLKYFLQYETKVSSPEEPAEPPADGDITLRDVSFSYGDTPVLRHVDLHIKKGEKVALVGYNGAGKTTLVKLLMRLYDPSEGEILYGGRNLREYRLSSYRELFETVFQDYQLFAATIAENLTLDTEPLDVARADEAMHLSGFADKLASLPDGYDTQITREFDNEGIELSGGEAQSLAIARALYRNSPVIILDEPSSALDPMVEYALNDTIFHTQKEKTIITISHRLSTTRMADRIYMLENGEIIESGTHEELMALGGKYAQMFTLQAKKYLEES